jgi:hypothetical protein
MAKPPATRKASGPLANIPAIDPALYSNVGRYAGAAVMTVFEQIGGTRRMAEWAEENPGDFYKSIYTKLINTPKSIEVSGRVSIDDAMRILDMEPGVDYTDVEDAQIEEEPE